MKHGGDYPPFVDDQPVLADLRPVGQIWLQGRSKLAARSSDSVHAIVTTSDHFIPEDDPATVVAATKSVIVAARGRGRLPGCSDCAVRVTLGRPAA